MADALRLQGTAIGCPEESCSPCAAREVCEVLPIGATEPVRHQPMVHHFIERKAGELKIGETPRLATGAIDDLIAYDWPGNVRELENLVERAMILHQGEQLTFDGLATSGPTATRGVPADEQPLSLDAVIARHIRRVLGMTAGKIHGPGGAGELLEMNPNTLRHRMKKLGIPFRKDLGPMRRGS